MNTVRPAVHGNRPSPGGRAIRGFIGLLLAASIGVAAIVWQSSYGDAAGQIIAGWPPQLVPTSSQPLENPGLSAQPSAPTARVVAAQTASPQAAPVARTASQDVAPTAAPVSPEPAQLLQTMARDLQTCRNSSSSSKRARNKWPATMQKPLSSSRRARNK